MDICRNIHWSILCNIQNLETTRISISNALEKQIMMYLQNELLHTSKNDHTIDTHYHMGKLKKVILRERSQRQISAYWTIPFIRNSRIVKTVCVEKSQSSGDLKGMTSIGKGNERIIWGFEMLCVLIWLVAIQLHM